MTTIGKTISNLVVKFAVPEYPPHVADEMLDIPIEALPKTRRDEIKTHWKLDHLVIVRHLSTKRLLYIIVRHLSTKRLLYLYSEWFYDLKTIIVSARNKNIISIGPIML